MNNLSLEDLDLEKVEQILKVSYLYNFCLVFLRLKKAPKSIENLRHSSIKKSYHKFKNNKGGTSKKRVVK